MVLFSSLVLLAEAALLPTDSARLNVAPVKSAVELTAIYYPGTEHMPEWDMIAETCPERQPLLGWYDEGCPEAVDWQIKWAVEHGITSFCVDWYWNRGSRRLEHWLKGYYRAANRKYLKWYMMYANHNQPGSHSTADQIAVTRYWIEHYFRTPEYYTLGGKPVVCLWSPENLDADFIAEAAARGEQLAEGEGVRRALALSDRLVREAGLPGIHWQLMWRKTEYDRAFADEKRREGFETAVSYGLIKATYDEVTAEMPKIWKEMCAKRPLDYWLPIPTGWDDRPRSFGKARVCRGRTIGKFAALCRQARDFCERNGIRHAVIHPINEWQEGSYLEPNEEYGFGMYDALRDAFCPQPAAGWPPNVRPDAAAVARMAFPPMSFSSKRRWDFDGSTEGWYRQPYGGGEVECHDGALTFVVNWLDNFNVRQRLVPFAASDYRAFRVRMKVVPNAVDGLGDTKEPRLRLTWGTVENPIIAPGAKVDFSKRVVTCPIAADGDWHEYVLPLAGRVDWRGDINELWFEAVNALHARVAVDWMEFTPVSNQAKGEK